LRKKLIFKFGFVALLAICGFLLSAQIPTITYTDANYGPLSGQKNANINTWCTGTVGTGNGTTYMFTPGANVANVCSGTTITEMPIALTCTAKNLYVNSGTAGAVAGSGVVALFKAGVATALTCTVGTGTTCNDTTHTVSMTAGNLWSVRVTTGQATDTSANLRASFQCQ
jgi:hypothetical protein